MTTVKLSNIIAPSFYDLHKDINWHTTNGAPPKPYLYPALLGNREYVFKSCKVELARAIRSAMA